jgi:DNA polymerase III gamma/tau subunit
MSINKLAAAADPREWHNSTLNALDRAIVEKRSLFVKVPKVTVLSATAIGTNVAAVAVQSFELFIKLALAGVKYGPINVVRAVTRLNAFQSLYNSMPNGKSLSDTTSRTAASASGVIYSFIGILLPNYNLNRQEKLGNFVNERKAQEHIDAGEIKKADESDGKQVAQAKLKTEAAKKAKQAAEAAEAAKKAQQEAEAAEAAKKAKQAAEAAEAAKKSQQEAQAAEAAKKSQQEAEAAEAAKKSQQEAQAAEAAKKSQQEAQAAEAAKKAQQDQEADKRKAEATAPATAPAATAAPESLTSRALYTVLEFLMG